MRGNVRLAAVALAATVLCRAPSFARPMVDPDEATFASVAVLMNTGARLYAEGGVDNKFPGIYWTYASVFRVFGRYAMGAVHAVALLVVFATALLLAWSARRISGSTRAAWLTVLFYGVFTSVYYPKMIAANTEIFMMLPLAGAFALTLSGRLFLAGVLVGVACVWKQIAIVCLPLPILAGLLDRKYFRAASALAGCAGVLALVAAWFRHQGTLDAWWHWTVSRLVSHYGPSGWRVGEYLTALAVGVFPFALAALVPVAGTAAVIARVRRTEAGERLALGWLALSAIGVAAGGRFFGHYFLQVAAPLCLLAAIEIDRRLTPRLAVAVGALTALPAIGFAVLAFISDPITQRFAGPPSGYRELAAHVRGHTAPEDRIFVWGIAGPFYLSADRIPATRFVGFLRGLGRDRGEDPANAWDAGPEVWPLLLADFAAHPPALVVDTAPADCFNFRAYPMARFPALARFVDEHYVQDTSFGGVDVYRHR